MRRFQLHRDQDITGVSGTGVVADGVLFPDGAVAIRWRGDRPSTVAWGSIEDAYHVHAHGGATRFVWLDPDPDASPPHRYALPKLALCGAVGRAPNGDRLDCNQCAGHDGEHCDGSRDNMWWRDGEIARV